MPIYNFRCPACEERRRVIRQPEKAKDPVECRCGTQMVRNPQGATSRITETLDNGIMSKRVERPADVERLNWERAHKPEPREP